MERLTVKYIRADGSERTHCVHFGGTECANFEGNCADGCMWEDAVWDKLRAYEDTGLTPERVKALRKRKDDAQSVLSELCKEIGYHRLQELAQADEEGRVQILPCKIGDEVWAIRDFKGHKIPQHGLVGEMYFTTDMRLQIVVKHIARGEWGNVVFPTREAAEKFLAERSGPK